jgi:DNA uptake protein ComE-like DNA-binding protein
MKRFHHAQGSVLIVVLWASLGLVSVALLFGHSMLMTYRGVDNDLAGHQAEQAIEGAARYVESLLANATTPGLLPDRTTYECEEMPVGEATFWLLGRPADAGNGTTREFGVVDEAGKLNLNTATDAMLQNLPGMTDELRAAILEWRDPNAAANSSSGGINTTVVKHGPFESIEELALVSGATREILYGEDANLNGVLDANEDDGDKTLPADNSDGKLDPGILEYVTVFSREPTKDSEGNARINLNVTPLPAELWTKIEEVLGAPERQRIEPLAGPGPFGSVLQFYMRSELSAEDFAKIAGYLTTSTAQQPRNPINVNTASETVLTCVLGADKAAAVVSARLGRSVEDQSVEWLKSALGASALNDAAELTIWSYQVTADVAAVGRHGRGYRRAKLVLDNSTGTPRIIYRRNLAALGWALGRDIRQSLALRKEIR